jgi:hypothetical protein
MERKSGGKKDPLFPSPFENNDEDVINSDKIRPN